MSAEGGSVVFLHAHPDDEAIFTGGTMARLAAAGWRVVLVVATNGELGLPPAPTAGPEELGHRRITETREAAAVLGAARVEFLGYRDSGLGGDGGGGHEHAFVRAPTPHVAATVSSLLREERAAALVTYDEHGIYGHPDHVKVHDVGAAAAEQAGTAVVYEATVDREYLHFVETHLVTEAGRAAGQLGLAASQLGVPTVAVTTVVDVRAVLDVKRRAMTAHASQIPETASAMMLPTEAFSAVYGYEWFLRTGPAGPLDSLS